MNTLGCPFQKAAVISLVVVQVVQRYGGTISEVKREVHCVLCSVTFGLHMYVI